ASDERFGAFVQAWATRSGQGKVFAWADSTIWSDFCTFEPGKIEMLTGIVEWLNHRNVKFDPRPVVWIVGVILFAAALQFSRGFSGAWLPLLSAAMLGWSLSGPALRAVHSAAMPLPRLKENQPDKPPFRHLVIDRTVCSTFLSRGGFIDGKPDGF